MGYDPFTPIASATLNVVCIPAGRTHPATFQQHVEWLQKNVRCVQLGTKRSSSVSSTRDSTGVQHSQIALYNVSETSSRNPVENSDYFEPNRSTQIVFGLLDQHNLSKEESEPDSTYFSDALDALTSTVEHVYGSDIAFGLIVFNANVSSVDGDVIRIGATSDGLNVEFQTWLLRITSKHLQTALERIRSSEVFLPKANAEFERPVSQDNTRDVKSEDPRRQSVMSTLTRTSSIPTQPSPLEEAAQASSSTKTVAAALIKLQMGNWSEALQQLADGARATRDANSPAWHAKALESILVCLMLHAWAGREFQIPQNCYPLTRGLLSSGAIHAISDANRAISEKYAGSSTHRMQALTAFLPGLVATIMNLYDRAVLDWDNSLPRILVCEARVRMAGLLSVIEQSGGIIDIKALDKLFGEGKELRIGSQIEEATANLNLQKSLIASLLAEAITEAQANLHILAAAPIYIAVCGELAKLNLIRKQGFWLKDVLFKLPPMLLESRRMSRVRQSAVQIGNGFGKNLMTRQDLRSLVSYALQTYDLPDIDLLEKSSDRLDEQAIQDKLSAWMSILASGDVGTKLEVLRLSVRMCDALPDAASSMKLMSILLFVARQTITISPAIPCKVPLLAGEEQLRLITGITNIATATQTQESQQHQASFWDDFLVRDVTVHEPASTGRLMPHKSSDLSLATKSGISKKDPFIYNPFSADAKTVGPTILVQNEIATFDVVLQNPLEIDVEIESISILTEGCIFESLSHSVIVGPLSAQVFTLQGVPKVEGAMKIVGCKAKTKHCYERQFSIYREQWKPSITTKRRSTTLQPVTLPVPKVLELKVVEALPQLRIIASSLVQPAVMLLDGETSQFSITLENSGDIPSDLILFTYKDSVSAQLQEALSNKDLYSRDIYELQYQLANRPTIRRIRDESVKSAAISIGPSSQETYYFELLGKAGLTEVVILIDYAYLGKPRSEVEGTFYTRQLKYTVPITVNGSVDIQRCAVLSPPDKAMLDGHDQATRDGVHASGQSLLQLDLRSFWQFPISVMVEIASQVTDKDEKRWTVATSTTLLPAQPTRTLIPFQKIYLEHPFEPIPSLSQPTRQFIVSASKLSLDTEMVSREVFWYRERVVNNIRMTWKEIHGDRRRHGQVDVRKGIRLSPRMIDALRIEHVQLAFDMPESISKDDFTISRNEFVKLLIKVHNASQEDLSLMLRLQPLLHDQPHNIATDLSKKFLWNGVLQKAIRPAIEPGQTGISELEVIGLVPGVYEVNATVEDLKAAKTGVDGLTSSERRIWYARKPALIHVVDS